MHILKNILITVAMVWAIFISYRYLTTRIYLKNSGVAVDGTVIESEKHPGYWYVKVSYWYKSQEYVKSFRLNADLPPAEKSVIRLRILPKKPEDPHLEFHDASLEYEIQGFFVLALGYLVYRFTRLMMITIRPSF